MPVEEHETTCSLGVGAPLTVPATTFAKVTGGDDSEDAQAAAAGTVPAPRRLSAQIWCCRAWTSCACSAFPSGNGAGKGDESPGDVVPRGDEMNFPHQPSLAALFPPLARRCAGMFSLFCSFTTALRKSEPKKCILRLLSFFITLTCTSGMPFYSFQWSLLIHETLRLFLLFGPGFVTWQASA